MPKIPKIKSLYIFAIFSEKYGDEVDFLCADKHKLFLQIDIIDLIICVYVMCVSVYGLSLLFLFKCQDRPRSSLHMPPYPQGKWQATPVTLCGTQKLAVLWHHLLGSCKASVLNLVL